MQAATVALILSASAIQHCVAGSLKVLRASDAPSFHDVLLRDESLSETHKHAHGAKISLMTIASERGPTKVHHSGPHHKTADVKESSHVEEARLSEVKQREARSSHTEQRRKSRADSASHDAASGAKTSANVVVHIDAKDAAIKAIDKGQVAANADSSDESGALAAGAVAYDDDATDGGEASAEVEFNNDGVVEEGGAVAIYHTIAETHADDTAEAENVDDVMDSAESEAETAAASDSKNAAISNVATASKNEADSQDMADSEAGADLEDVTDSEGVAAERAANSEVAANSAAGDTSQDDVDVEDTTDSDEATVVSVSDSKGPNVEVAEGVEIASESEVPAPAPAGDSATEADTSTESDIAGSSEMQPDANSTVAVDDLPGQVHGQDGEVIPEPTPSGEGEGARTDPGSDQGSLDMGSSAMLAEAVGPADAYHDGSTESEDWGKEYGAAAQAFHDRVAAGDRRSSSSPRQGSTGGGSGSTALAAGLILIIGLLVCALGLGTKI